MMDWPLASTEPAAEPDIVCPGLDIGWVVVDIGWGLVCIGWPVVVILWLGVGMV
jgi:hypothetical protein